MINAKSKGIQIIQKEPEESPIDWKEYFRKNVVVGMEMELEHSHGGRITNKWLIDSFGVEATGYHNYPRCEVCSQQAVCTARLMGIGHREFQCNMQSRDNMIVAIQHDATIDGHEFLLNTGTISTLEFQKRLPLRKISEHYEASSHCGLHVHLVIPWNTRPIPMFVLENFYNLFAYYYGGLVWCMGTNGSRILRGGYANFTSMLSYSKPHRAITSSTRDALHFGKCRFLLDKCIQFDVEIRLPDASTNINHIALVRFLSRSLLERAGEISNFGKIVMHRGLVVEKKALIRNINERHFRDIYDKMENSARELYIELAHLFDAHERKIMNSIIENPIWKLNGNNIHNLDIEVKDDDTKIQLLKCLLTMKTIQGMNRKSCIKEYAGRIRCTESYTRNILAKIGASYDKETQTFVLR